MNGEINSLLVYFLLNGYDARCFPKAKSDEFRPKIRAGKRKDNFNEHNGCVNIEILLLRIMAKYHFFTYHFIR